MSAISDALKKDKRADILVEMTFGRITYRIGTNFYSYGDRHFKGLMTAWPSVRFSFSMDSRRSANTTADITFANQDRFQDMQLTSDIDSGDATIWLVSPSMAWADVSAQPIFHGKIRMGPWDRHTCVVSILDWALGWNQKSSTFSAQTALPSVNLLARLVDFTTLTTDKVDPVAAYNMDSLFPFDTVMVAEQESTAFDLVDRVLAQLHCGRTTKNGKLSWVIYDPFASATGQILIRDIIGDGSSMQRTDPTMVVNSLDVSYDYNTSTSEWDGSFSLSAENNTACYESVAVYGEQPTFYLKMADVDDADFALLLAERFLSFRAFRHDVATVVVPFHVGFDMHIGMVAEVDCDEGPTADGSGWSREPCILLDRAFTSGGIVQRWWRIGTD